MVILFICCDRKNKVENERLEILLEIHVNAYWMRINQFEDGYNKIWYLEYKYNKNQIKI